MPCAKCGDSPADFFTTSGLLGGFGMLALSGDVEKGFFLIAAFGFATAARGYKVRHLGNPHFRQRPKH